MLFHNVTCLDILCRVTPCLDILSYRDILYLFARRHDALWRASSFDIPLIIFLFTLTFSICIYYIYSIKHFVSCWVDVGPRRTREWDRASFGACALSCEFYVVSSVISCPVISLMLCHENSCHLSHVMPYIFSHHENLCDSMPLRFSALRLSCSRNNCLFWINKIADFFGKKNPRAFSYSRILRA